MEARELMARAESFLEAEARLLERRLFAACLRGAPREPALLALRAYQNDDGGFGNALLPEARDPESSLGATVYALQVLDDLDSFWSPLLDDVFKYLTRQLPSLPETVQLAVPLLAHGVIHPWLDHAVEYCERTLSIYAEPPAGSGSDPPSIRVLGPALAFLAHADAAGLLVGAEALRTRVEQLILEWDLVEFDPEAPPSGRTPIDWAPDPMAPARRMFTADQIERHLRALAARQQDDGGWPLDRAALSASGALERRGVCTLRALCTLRAYAVL